LAQVFIPAEAKVGIIGASPGCNRPESVRHPLIWHTLGYSPRLRTSTAPSISVWQQWRREARIESGITQWFCC
jgi:hypothetical protein